MSAATGTLRYFTSSVGRKALMAVTGLIWSGFVFTHMAANMLIIFDKDAYNKYSHALITNPLIYVAEAALVVTILLHAYEGIALFLRNQDAKPQKYAVKPSRVKGASLAAKTMIYSGSIMLVFLILHLITFKFGTHYDVVVDGVRMRDIHRLVIEVFKMPAYVIWYFVSMIFVGLHLYHGVSSGFQTLGINHPRYNKLIKYGGWLYAIVVAAGFLSQPLYVFFIHKQ